MGTVYVFDNNGKAVWDIGECFGCLGVVFVCRGFLLEYVLLGFGLGVTFFVFEEVVFFVSF